MAHGEATLDTLAHSFLGKHMVLRLKIALFLALSLLCLSSAEGAGGQCTAEVFLRSNLDRVIRILQNKDIQQQKKNGHIDEIVTPMFDFALIAKLALGRQYWTALTQPDQDRFTELFVKRLKKTYFDTLALYKGEEIIYEPPVESDKKSQIPTYLVSKDKKTSILYKLYQAEDNWKIYDIEIQGVSIVRSYRSQFDDILEKGTIQDLLLKLEQSVENN